MNQLNTSKSATGLSARSREQTARSLSRRVWALYRNAPFVARTMQALRPYICPFDDLVRLVPADARLLDVGCGAGLFIVIMGDLGHIRSATGFDSNSAAVAAANSAAAVSAARPTISFERLDATAPWPAGQYDAVTLIDVMHHIPPDAHRGVLEGAAKSTVPGGVVIYKDMVSRPLWRAWANRLHDLLLAQQWIHYVGLDQVEKWAAELGLSVVQRGQRNLFWYGHEWVVLRKRDNG